MKNPFILKPYHSKDLFCDREQEISILLANITNERNTTLISPRRMGKTGLIFRTFDEIKSLHKEINTCYVDIFATRSLSDFIKFFAESVFEAFPEKTTIGNKFMNFIKALRPVFTFDPITNQPQISIHYQNLEEKEQTLKQIFHFLDSLNIKIVIAFDEFQQIRDYPETHIEALLRTYIQQIKNVQFIFCGSKRHILTDMFANPKSPFYASTQFLELGKINLQTYREFIKNQFTKNNYFINEDAVDFILGWTKQHTYYTQVLCNKVFELNKNHITIDEVKFVCAELLAQNQSLFLQYRQMLTNAQWNFLIAIAKESEVSQIMASNFLMKYEIGTPANAKRLQTSLMEKELLLSTSTKSGQIYSVYDVFLSRWMEREY